MLFSVGRTRPITWFSQVPHFSWSCSVGECSAMLMGVQWRQKIDSCLLTSQDFVFPGPKNLVEPYKTFWVKDIFFFVTLHFLLFCKMVHKSNIVPGKMCFRKETTRLEMDRLNNILGLEPRDSYNLPHQEFVFFSVRRGVPLSKLGDITFGIRFSGLCHFLVYLGRKIKSVPTLLQITFTQGSFHPGFLTCLFLGYLVLPNHRFSLTAL